MVAGLFAVLLSSVRLALCTAEQKPLKPPSALDHHRTANSKPASARDGSTCHGGMSPEDPCTFTEPTDGQQSKAEKRAEKTCFCLSNVEPLMMSVVDSKSAPS
ncbi:hypothetical protein BKA80DRAFT_286250 [Phyllosticta citrichinensis]